MSFPFVSIVIPTRNEEQYIQSCLESIVQGDYPKNCLEVLVVDGRSDDYTRELVEAAAVRHSFIQLLDNPQRTVPYAMNVGVRAARGEIVVRMDAHARYGRNYVSLLVEWLDRLKADNVGGIWITHPANEQPEAKAVAAILSHPFGVGNARYRIGLDAPMEVDTVPFGCYRKEVFERIGLYDELFTRNQDDELNARLRNNGGRIYLVPEIRVDYYARETLKKMAIMLYQYGYFKPLVAIKVGRPATLRQFAPPAFAITLLGLPFLAPFSIWAVAGWSVICSIYALANLAVSISIAKKQGWVLLPKLSVGFLLAHLAYGVGYLSGLVDFGLLRRHRRLAQTKIPLSR